MKTDEGGSSVPADKRSEQVLRASESDSQRVTAAFGRECPPPGGPDALGAAGASPSSLVSYRHIREWAQCDRVDFDFINSVTGELISGRCKAYGCDYCGPRKLQLLELCLVAAMPQRFITLTLAPEDKSKRDAQFRDLVRRLRKDGLRIETARVFETNPTDNAPEGSRGHIHALQKGDYIDQRHLEMRWGGRRVDIRALDSIGGGVSGYMLKVHRGTIRAAGYALKQQDGTRQRPVNFSADFFDGEKLENVRARVKGLLYGSEPSVGDWVRVPRSQRA